MEFNDIIANLPTPYYRDNQADIAIYCADCRDILPLLPDKSIDLVLTDPPYGIGAANVKRGGRKDGHSITASRDYGHLHWDDNKPPAKIFDEIFRVSEAQVIFGGEHLCHLLPQSRGWIFWDKDTGNNDYADGELVWTSFDKALRKFKWRWKGMFQEDMANKEIRVHPTQKPAPLINWIIGNYGKDCDLILDPFLGSGTTAYCAKKLGRKCIGIEIEEKYCEIATKRCSQSVMRL